MYIIGLTGTYCAGKNYVARFLELRGLPVLDVDKLGHKALEAEKPAVLERFGPLIVGNDGGIDRRLLGEKVFDDAEALQALENIVHPVVNQLVETWIEAQAGKACVINAALLHKTAFFSELRFTILVQAPWLVRLGRAKKRDRLPWKQIVTRFGSQKKWRAQYFRKNADTYIVYNGGFFESFFKGSVASQLDRILSLKGLQIQY
ncbi:MAG: dephospho-CoA kinase [Spirochaetaceae bacterium]|jgi:dephospho-CoA kinase|nr:dephospho-CoA kinase [Spirochaetaceae bacterium]